MKLKRMLRAMLLSMLFLAAFQQMMAQNRTIRGSVSDEKNNPVAGASITIKGSSAGTAADSSGNFLLIVPASAKALAISSVGYNNQEINIGSKTTLSIVLIPPSQALTDVVVVGYGTARKKDLTGAVSTISNKDLNPGPVTSPLQQIAGKAAGVNVIQVGSEPGSAPGVRIRGITSLVGGSDPLVVVDGVQGNMDLFRQVPPTEIESVDVLKDASATAIYGSRGAPGVIIVTTKKNRAGRSTVEFNTTASVDMIRKKLDVLNAEEWWQQAQKYNVPASENHASNTDMFDILTLDGFTQNHAIAFGGGAEKFNYRASVAAILQKGIVINSNFKNYIGRIQATQKALDDKLTLTMNLNSNISNTIGSPASVGRAAFTSNLISNAYVARPTDPVFNADGTYFTDPNVFQYINPYAVSQEVSNESGANNLFGSLRADVDVLKGLTASWFGSWRKTNAYAGYYLPAISTVSTAIDNKGIANISNNRAEERLMDISLNYKKTFRHHRIEALALYEYQTQVYQGNFAQAKGFINDITTFNALQNGDLSKVTPGDVSSYKNDRNLVSFLGRINYSFSDRYLVTASLRRDGASVLGVNNKWGNFPSASVAWRLSQESFMEHQKIFSDLKLRVGYGVTGNQQGLYPQNSTQLVGSAGVTYFGGSQITNFIITQNANSDLKWETRKQANIGLDFAIMNNSLSGSVDVFKATTSNLLFNYSVPQPPYPYGSILANVGRLLNEGVELSLNYRAIKGKDITLTLSGNVSFLRNRVLELSGSINGVPLNTDYVGWGSNSYLIKGMAIGTFNVLQHQGINGVGEQTVVDKNKDGVIDQGNQSPDRYIAGSSVPKYTYAFTPYFSYKNFDASMLWRGSGGNKLYNDLRSNLSRFENLGKSNVLTSAIPLGLFTTKYGSDLWLENGAFLRFDNLNIGYRFNTKNSKYIEALRVSLTGNNLAVITRYTGIDPELGGGYGSAGDNGIYPRTRSIAAGLNVIFK
ncbi:MAG: TonB-dependent receptor [Ferruginibacter sp.]|nr:TonB-dependent receptor [Ferruginibacter sp.]